MCGIVGFIDFKKRSCRQMLKDMTDGLEHRGPDDQGSFFLEKDDCQIGLGHRRLAVLDLSPNGHQPMAYDDLEIVYNGEVYNFKEIRSELLQAGYSFFSDSDTEVVLKAFHKWGVDSVKRFNGMFSFAIYNNKENILTIVRDRLGIKPLYYFFDNNAFLFSSELKSFFQFPSYKRKISKPSLNLFLFHGYITAPYSIFEDTYKLEPGSFLELNTQTRQIKKNSFWSIPDIYEKRELFQTDEEQILQDFDELLTEAVAYRMVSDVPIGSFLSGGYDSSLVSAIMQKLSTKPIDTFTIGFNESHFDEAHHAKNVAKYLGTNHNELYLPMQSAEELINAIPEYYDEPFADSSQLPTMLVSRFAREKVTVTLSGDGGDELFCGYGRYSGVLKYQRYKMLGQLCRLVPECIGRGGDGWKLAEKISRFKALANDNSIINYAYLNSKLYLTGLVKDTDFLPDSKYFNILELSKNIQEKYMLQDLITYLPDDILTKVDRASMAFSLEARLPLLDYRVVEFAMNVPHELKYRAQSKKYLLKKLAHRYLPQEMLDRPKQGFGVPVYEWLRGDLHYLLEKYLDNNVLTKQGVFNTEKIHKIVSSFMQRDQGPSIDRLVWHLLVFQMWFSKYMKNND